MKALVQCAKTHSISTDQLVWVSLLMSNLNDLEQNDKDKHCPLVFNAFMVQIV